MSAPNNNNPTYLSSIYCAIHPHVILINRRCRYCDARRSRDYADYVRLRNNPGIQGERGEPGLKGSKGSQGTCVIDTSCDALQNCNELIENTLRNKISEYKGIREKMEKGHRLSNKEKKIIEGIQTYKSILLVKCESGAYTREEFKDIVTDSLDVALSY